MGVLAEAGDLLRYRELIQLQHTNGAVACRQPRQPAQQGAHRGGVESGELAGEGGQRH